MANAVAGGYESGWGHIGAGTTTCMWGGWMPKSVTQVLQQRHKGGGPHSTLSLAMTVARGWGPVARHPPPKKRTQASALTATELTN